MTYRMKKSNILTRHWSDRVLVLRDGASPKPPHSRDRTELRAQVASHDYFALLATHLDHVSQSLSGKQKSEYLELESAISDLLYLHQFYQIVKK
jgi:hypothetical protein